MTKEKYVHIGDTGVDSGKIMITDPCYWMNDTEMHRLIEHTEEYNNYEVPFDLDDPGDSNLRGVVAYTRDGDGIYPVFAVLDEKGEVVRLEVVFKAEKEDARYSEYYTAVEESLEEDD